MHVVFHSMWLMACGSCLSCTYYIPTFKKKHSNFRALFCQTYLSHSIPQTDIFITAASFLEFRAQILEMKKYHKPVRSRSTTLRQPSDSVFRLVFKSTSVIDFDDLADILKFLYFIPTTTTSSVLFLSINSTNYLESCHFKYVHNSQRTRYTGNIFCPHLKKSDIIRARFGK